MKQECIVDGNHEHNCPVAEEMRKEEINTTPKEEWAQEFKDKFSLQLQGCHGKDSEALDLIRSVLLPNTEDHEA